jgi:hypothetical protein
MAVAFANRLYIVFMVRSQATYYFCGHDFFLWVGLMLVVPGALLILLTALLLTRST